MSALRLLSPDPALEARLRQALGAPDAADLRRWKDEYRRIDPTKVAAELAEEDADVVCLGPELDEPTALGLAAAFDLEHPAVSVVMLAEPSPRLWTGALGAGVRGLVSPTAPAEELRAVVDAAADAAARRRSATAMGPPPSRRSRSVVVVSAKGGVGKTTVAVNLATAMARTAPGEVALLDLDLQFGDAATSLQLAPEHSLLDVARSSATLDATSLKVFLASHPSGVWALCAPDSPADADDVAAQHGAGALRLLGEEFPFVVVDTAAGLDEHTLAAAELATDLLFVTTLDVPSIRSLRKELTVLDSLGVTDARRHLVLNRADAKVGLQVHDVEAALGMTVDLALPSSRAVPLAANHGLTLLESDPRAPVTRQLEQLAARFAPSSTPPTSSGGFLRRRKDAR